MEAKGPAPAPLQGLGGGFSAGSGGGGGLVFSVDDDEMAELMAMVQDQVRADRTAGGLRDEHEDGLDAVEDDIVSMIANGAGLGGPGGVPKPPEDGASGSRPGAAPDEASIQELLREARAMAELERRKEQQEQEDEVGGPPGAQVPTGGKALPRQSKNPSADDYEEETLPEADQALAKYETLLKAVRVGQGRRTGR